jgi:hypothetical protein
VIYLLAKKAKGGRMKYVKVLDKDLRPPIQGGKPYEIDVWHHCEDFDTSDTECAPGFYVIPVSELIYYHKPWMETKVLPAEVKGNSKIFSAAKQRYEYIKLGNPLSDNEVKALCREIEHELGYKLSEVLYPVNPLLLPKATVNDDDLELLKQWDSVRYGVGDIVRSSIISSAWDGVMSVVWDSVWYSSGDSVLNSVISRARWNARYSVKSSIWDSVWNCVGAYIGSMFPSINKWKYKTYEQGQYPFQQYPFQSAVNLWYRGLVPSFDGKIWRLHSGEKAEIVWTEPEIGWLKAREGK